jgi:hypothetical protein
MELIITTLADLPRVDDEMTIAKELSDLEMAIVGGGCAEATPY